jgi:hypothetical protein
MDTPPNGSDCIAFKNKALGTWLSDSPFLSTSKKDNSWTPKTWALWFAGGEQRINLHDIACTAKRAG